MRGESQRKATFELSYNTVFIKAVSFMYMYNYILLEKCD